MTTAATPRGPLAEAIDVVRDRLGLRVDGALVHRLRRAMAEGAARMGLTPEEWVSQLPRRDEILRDVVTAVTIHETAWFRDRPQFEALAREVLPRVTHPVIWCAGCSQGQEAYSLAMVLRETGRRTWRVLATDLDDAAVAATEAGVYSPNQLAGLDPRYRDRWLREDSGTGWVVTPELRRQVIARQHNVAVDPVPPEVIGCQVVFCRNVLIYLSPPAAAGFLGRLADALAPGAAVFIGGGEALWRGGHRFRAVEAGGCFFYRSHPPAVPALGSSRPPRPRIAHETPEVLLARGQAALDAGDHDAAIGLLRRAARTAPDLVVAQFSLGLALQATGNHHAARRAWLAAKAAITRAEPGHIESALDGHTAADLAAAIDALLARPGAS